MLAMLIEAAIAQLGERQTEDLKVPGSIPGLGILILLCAATATTKKNIDLTRAAKRKHLGDSMKKKGLHTRHRLLGLVV